ERAEIGAAQIPGDPEEAEHDRQRENDRDVRHYEKKYALRHTPRISLRPRPSAQSSESLGHSSRLARWCRKRPTSVTTPTVCIEPRSASFVTTAGLMSTQTTRTHEGSMLPTPMLCNIDDSISTSCTFWSAAA